LQYLKVFANLQGQFFIARLVGEKHQQGLKNPLRTREGFLYATHYNKNGYASRVGADWDGFRAAFQNNIHNLKAFATPHFHRFMDMKAKPYYDYRTTQPFTLY
jgi:hypothetical protein